MIKIFNKIQIYWWKYKKASYDCLGMSGGRGPPKTNDRNTPTSPQLNMEKALSYPLINQYSSAPFFCNFLKIFKSPTCCKDIIIRHDFTSVGEGYWREGGRGYNFAKVNESDSSMALLVTNLVLCFHFLMKENSIFIGYL